jgi:hypothetical protein
MLYRWPVIFNKLSANLNLNDSLEVFHVSCFMGVPPLRALCSFTEIQVNGAEAGTQKGGWGGGLNEGLKQNATSSLK